MVIHNQTKHRTKHQTNQHERVLDKESIQRKPPNDRSTKIENTVTAATNNPEASFKLINNKYNQRENIFKHKWSHRWRRVALSVYTPFNDRISADIEVDW